MAIKKINTDLELEAKLIDINASSGTNGQILSSTSTGITWIAPVINNNQLTNGAGYATQTYVTTAVSNLVDTAPGTLDTLNELAAALGDDPNFATTVSTSIGTKLAKSSNLSDLTSTSTARTNLGLGVLATLSTVDAATITDNSVGAAELNVTGNGTTAQFLRSDGDGTFTWATPTDTNTTYSVGNGGLTEINFTSTLNTKLAGIATGANNYVLPFTDNSTNWNTAYGWGNHAAEPYRQYRSRTITGVSFDPVDTYQYYEIGRFVFESLQGVITFDLLFSGNGLGAAYRYSVPVTYAMDYVIRYGITAIPSNTWVVWTPDFDTPRHYVTNSDDVQLQLRVISNTVEFRVVVTTPSGTSGSTGTIFANITHSNEFVGGTYTELTGTGTDATAYTVIPSLASPSYGVSRFSGEIYSRGNIISAGTVTATGGNSTQWNTAYGWGNHASAGYLTTYTDTNTTYTAGTGLTLSGTTFSVTSNGISATQLNVSGNGTTSQYLRSDGDGTFSWVTPPDTNTTYSVGNGGLTEINFTSALNTKLAGIATGANNYVLPFTDNSSNWNTAYGWGNHASQGYATQTYVNTAVSNLVAAAPGTLDTLNELAAALGDDPNFATTVSTSIGTKLTKSSNLSDLTSASTARTNLGLGVLATLSTVDAATITDNSVGAAELNVTGNGTTAQFLRSDGDGTFTWATPTDTNTTYSVGNGGLTEINFTSALNTKLAGIATNANNYVLPFVDNSTNWNTAFGWGNHATQGYASQTYTTTLNTAGSFLGGHYSSGGNEKPNSATFGAGKLKLAMLSNGNLGFGGGWNDVLWLSGYTGADVKSSHALVFDKGSSNVWVSDQNFDSGTWGTGYKLWHSGNGGAGTGLDADLLDGQQGTYYQPASTAITTSNIGAQTVTNSSQLGGYTLDTMKKYIWSRGENLLTNGTGLLGNNTNFSTFTFVGTEAYFSNGAFSVTAQQSTRRTDELMPVNPAKRYRFDFWAKTANGVGKYYSFLDCYDADGNAISATHHMYVANTLTTLAVDLIPGATTVTLTGNGANYNNGGTAGTSTHLRSLIIWEYTNSFGYKYEPETYSRLWYGNLWDPGAVSGNVITLRVPWTGPTYPAGTRLSNGSAGGSFKYVTLVNTIIPSTWTNYVGIMTGVDYSGTNASGKFPPGTAAIKLGFLTDYNLTGDTAYFANLFVGVDPEYPAFYDTFVGSTKIETSGAFYGTVFNATGGNSTNWNTAYADRNKWDGGATGLVASTGRTSLGLGTLATLSTVDAATITDNSVGAAELNVSGNGTTAQFLRSDGDGTFTWATPTDTNTTYSVGNGGLTEINFTSALNTKLAGIATNANNYVLPFTDNSTNWNTAYGWGNHASQGYATQTYVNTAVSNLVASAPGTLDTLNELAAALGDDPNFATTVSTSIGTKLAKGNNLSDLTSVSTARTNLGLGTLATLSTVDAATITDNSVGAAELNVTGNGTAVQFLRSDGDGTFTWATPTDTNTTYSVGNGGLTEINFTSTLNTKLAGIATNANNYVLPVASSTIVGGIEVFSDTVQTVAATAVSATASRTYGVQLNAAGQAVVNVPWVNTDTNTTYTAGTGLLLTGTVFSNTITNNNQLTNGAGYTTNTGTVTGVTGTAPIISSGGTAPAISISAATTGAAGSMSAADKSKLDGIATGANAYVLPAATATALGGIELFSATAQTITANAVSATASRTYGLQVNSAGQGVVNIPWTDNNTTYTAGTGLALTGTVFSNTITNNNQLTNGAGYTTNTGTITGSGTTNYIPKLTSATALGNSSIFDNGNVGIGIANPSHKLHVSGNRILVENIIDAGIMLRTASVDRYSVASTSGNFAIHDEVNSVDRLHITSAGDVGIGTTSPTEKLDVSGVINAASFSANGTAGFTGTVVFASNPPGSQMLEFQGGLLVGVS